jgi:DNA-binding MarR family transcriptional regulator
MTDDLKIYEAIIEAFQVVTEEVKGALAPFKITAAQFGVLRRVGHGEVVSLTELARRLGCSNANVTRLVDNMIKAGLVERATHPWDRRVAPVRLTARGFEVRGKAASAYARAVNRVVSQLRETERSAFLAMRARFE